MNPVLEFLTSHGYQTSVFNLSIICIVLALGAIIVALVFYGRARESMPANAEHARWQMLFATWRDSLIITMLYVAEGFLWRASDFQGLSNMDPRNLITYVPFIQPIISLVIYVLIFTVVAMRIIALTRWLHQTATQFKERL